MPTAPPRSVGTAAHSAIVVSGGLFGGVPDFHQAYSLVLSREESLQTLHIPFMCQWDLKPGDEPSADFCAAAGVIAPPEGWAERCCGIACLAMLLAFWDKHAQLRTLLHEAIESGAWGGERNWRHTELVGLLSRRGLTAWRRNWRLLEGRERAYLDGRIPDEGTVAELDRVRSQMINEGLYSLEETVNAGQPVIVSVYRPAWDRSSPGHMIVLTGWHSGELRYHDPAERDGASSTTSIADFRRSWKGTAIFAAAREPGTVSPGTVSSRTS